MPTSDLTPFIGPLLVLAGVVLQFLVRQFKIAGEPFYWLVVVMLCSTVYVLTTRNALHPTDPQGAIISFVLWLVGASAAVRGGSSATDSAAHSAVQANPGLAGNPLVPKTNSL